MVNYPKDWEEKKLGNLAFIKTGNKNNEDKVSGGKYPFYVRSEKVERINTFSYDTEAILVPGEGNIGSVFHYVNGKFDVHQRVYAITNFSDTLNAKYLYWFMIKNFGSYALSQTSKATVDSLRLPAFKNFDVVIPPFPEQQAIADALTAFDTHINNLAKLIEKKKMIRDGAVEDLVSGKRRLAGFSGKWESKSLLDIAIILNGLTYKPEDVRPYGKLVIRSSNIKDGKLVYIDNVYVDEAKSTSEDVAIGDVIICVRNGSSALIGKSAYVQENIDATVGAFMSNIRCHNTHLSKFFYYFTKTETFKDFINEVLGATINQITKSDLKRLKFAIPLSLSEQQAIADILTAMDKEISDLEEEKEKYIALKAGAMDDLLTGKIRLV